MKCRTLLCVTLGVMCGGAGIFAQGLSVSGLLDSTVSVRAGTGDSPAFSYGVEEYANVRAQVDIRGAAAVYGAVNCIAAAGDPAWNARLVSLARSQPGMSAAPYATGTNYIADIELERLYFKLNGDTLSFEAGLLRLPFGYSVVWGPSDFLNPKNPLVPDARPRAILGGGLSWYPADDLKLLGFGASSRDPFSREGGGLAGLALERHWARASAQLLYAFEAPSEDAGRGIHRAGMSVKADVEVSLIMEMLYAYNDEAGTRLDGLSFCFGADYSFFDGKLLALAEYLYSGTVSSTSVRGGGSFFRNNYVYASCTWLFTDYTNVSAALLSGLDDVSFTPVITVNHDLFQGAVLTIMAQFPLDRDSIFGNGKKGELGSLPPDNCQPLLPVTGTRAGSYCNVSAKLRLRF